MTAVAEPVVVSHHATGTRRQRTVLVLNASYEPLQRVSLRHAIRMLVREVAVVEEAHPEARFGPFPVPKVLRLVRYVVMRWVHARTPLCTKGAVKARDRHCGYCGGPAETVDHILPRSRGGLLTWENAVAACLRCNHRKGDRTPAEAGMTLIVTPAAPRRSPLT
ncbi:HNH endonuclease [Mumia sp. zg.B53]|uniref:HNH endonuclease n=1 Tax=unclassified Mumia TaxID=2621872 RepID=UPI001C6EC95B|nr:MULTISPECIES: HNH endonuclease [unclassified Mumia]MBW9209909.1 HNH endonuclease [Mumia sp. zg.B21]MBW9214513.1 HNH endonuclease [Mumia sp. zg.B53]MDD9348163.1 HNH endonuclease [Mumia sp.]